MVSGCGLKKSGKINGAQEMEDCREVKGHEEDEQCGTGEISQSCEISEVAKFCNLRNFTSCENSQTWKFLHCFKNSLPSVTPTK